MKLNKLLYFGLVLLCCQLPNLGLAHDARPLSVTIVEQIEQVYRVIVRAPPTLKIENSPSMIWPENCEIRESRPLNQTLGSTSLLSCDSSLQGQEISLAYPEFNPSLTTLFRLETLEGVSITTVLAPDQLTWMAPESPSALMVAKEYTLLGFEHIWAGIDHLLFVAGLLLLARTPRKIIFAITGFTAAHSITLSLASLDLVRAPSSLVEAMIALSIVFLAAEIARNNEESFSHRYPVTISFAFGLLHGFGFASVLGEISLPTNEVITGLLFFNVGVELGQLAFIFAIFAWLFLMVKIRHFFHQSSELVLNPELIKVGAYVLGLPAAFWFVERSLVVFL